MVLWLTIFSQLKKCLYHLPPGNSWNTLLEMLKLFSFLLKKILMVSIKKRKEESLIWFFRKLDLKLKIVPTAE